MKRRQVIYRAWDGECLLYLGITMNPVVRFSFHGVNASWWERTTAITLEHLPVDTSREQALEIEALAIREERPFYNVLCKPRALSPEPQYATSVPARCSPQADSEYLSRIIKNRAEKAETETELPQLVRAAFDAGATWQQVAAELNVSKARVYQLRAQGG